MTKTKKDLVNLIYKGRDPFMGFEYQKDEVNMDGIFDWNGDHFYLQDTIEKANAKIIIEAGVFRGGSIITMANKLKQIGDGCIIAIDTFLGDHMLFEHDSVQHLLKRRYGRAELWRIFYANILELGLQDYVLPLHLDTFAGLRLLNGKHRGSIRLQADMVHIDASHVSPMPYIDTAESWDCLRPGGWIVVDDWVPNQVTIDHDGADFRGIYSDVTKFCAEKGVAIEHDISLPRPFKCRFQKPNA